MARYCLNAFAAALVVMLAISDARAEIQIGIAAPLTGAYAWSGEHVIRGGQMAIDDLNAAGGVLGQLLKPVIVDDYCAWDEAIGRRTS